MTSPPHPAPAPIAFHAFPSLDRLRQLSPLELRAHGFGYRADYLTNTAALLHSLGGLPHLHSLRSPSHTTPDVYTALQQLPGVGPKVAACVALFSLDRLDLIPVDTHVWQIALREYRGELSAGVRGSKGVTKRVHEEVGELFRGKFGEYAGWAHSVLFTAELPAFRHRLQVKVEVEEEVEGGGGEVRLVKVEEEVVQDVETYAGRKAVERKRKGRGGKENVKEEALELPTPTRRRVRTEVSTTTTTTSTSTSLTPPLIKVEERSEEVTEVREVKEVKVEATSTALASSTLQFPVTKHPRLRIPKKPITPLIRRTAPMLAG